MEPLLAASDTNFCVLNKGSLAEGLLMYFWSPCNEGYQRALSSVSLPQVLGARKGTGDGFFFFFFFSESVRKGRRLCLKNSQCSCLSSVQFSPQSCPTLCDPMNHSTPGLPVHYQLPEFTQTHIHRVGDAIQPSHPLSSPSPPAPNPSQHQLSRKHLLTQLIGKYSQKEMPQW